MALRKCPSLRRQGEDHPRKRSRRPIRQERQHSAISEEPWSPVVMPKGLVCTSLPAPFPRSAFACITTSNSPFPPVVLPLGPTQLPMNTDRDDAVPGLAIGIVWVSCESCGPVTRRDLLDPTRPMTECTLRLLVILLVRSSAHTRPPKPPWLPTPS